MIKFTVISLFPDLINSFKNTSIVKRAIDNGKVSIDTVDLREFGEGKWRNVDDTIYGGGTGQVIKVPILDKAFDYILSDEKNLEYKKKHKIIYLTPKGKVFKQGIAKSMALNKDDFHYILLCGHYEGVDERIFKLYDIEEISIGDYVLTGGEIPAMVLIDSVTRLIDGVLKDDATLNESFEFYLLEESQYTKPAEYKGMKVPDILVSGNHEKIKEYRIKESIDQTIKKRPELFEEYKKKNKKEGK